MILPASKSRQFASALLAFAKDRSFEPPSSLLLSLESSANQLGATTDRTFEAIPPDTSQLIAFGSIAVLSAIAVYVWANEVVPVSRTNLALSKRSGAVKEYLEDLQAAENVTSSVEDDNQDSRDFERWLFTDWLTAMDRTISPRQKKEPALPILKKAKWNSGDNPVLAATALILLGVVITSITERIASIVS